MEKAFNPIVCVFDSGIGGLCLLYECVRVLPNVDFAYFSDNANVPYGSLSQERLTELTDIHFLKISELNPIAAVIACNTVTANCIDFIRKKYPFEVIGIQPAVKPAAALGGKCLVLATPSTAKSKSLCELIDKYGFDRVEVVSCADLAQYIENNIHNLDEAAIYDLLPQVSCDSVVLGCTHYVYIKDVVTRRYNCRVFDGIEGTAHNLASKIAKSDHFAKRAQKIVFDGEFGAKNRTIFNNLVLKHGLKGIKN